MWDKDSNLTPDESTAHNRRVLAVEGEGVEVEFYPDGAPRRISGASRALVQWSEPTDAAGAYAHLADKNAEVAGELVGLAKTLATRPGSQANRRGDFTAEGTEGAEV